jgi:hypothetical protein
MLQGGGEGEGGGNSHHGRGKDERCTPLLYPFPLPSLSLALFPQTFLLSPPPRATRLGGFSLTSMTTGRLHSLLGRGTEVLDAGERGARPSLRAKLEPQPPAFFFSLRSVCAAQMLAN